MQECRKVYSIAPENPRVEPVLKYISFTAEPGKITLLNLIECFYEIDGGQIVEQGNYEELMKRGDETGAEMLCRRERGVGARRKLPFALQTYNLRQSH